MRKSFLIVFVAVVFLMTYPSFCHARRTKSKQVIVDMGGGDFVRGWVVKNKQGTQSLVDIEGNVVDLSGDEEVLEITELEKEFKKQKFDIKKDFKKKDETKDYVNLIEWGRERQLYESVEKLAMKIVRRNRSNPNQKASEALDWARDKMKILKTARPPKDMGWSQEDVMKIRFALLPVDGSAGRTQVKVRGDFIRRFVSEEKKAGLFKTADDEQKFLKMTRVQQAQFIKKNTGFKYQKDVQISNDPEVILEFRKRVIPMLKKIVDRNGFLGGDDAGLKLIMPMRGSADLYGNFFLLDTYRAEDGDMLDHEQPEASLILTYLMPKSESGRPARRGKSVIRSKEDPKYKQIISWIKSLPRDKIDELMGEKVGEEDAQHVIASPSSGVAISIAQ